MSGRERQILSKPSFLLRKTSILDPGSIRGTSGKRPGSARRGGTKTFGICPYNRISIRRPVIRANTRLFDIWAYNWISIHGPVIRANELLFEILRQCPGREAARERFWALKIQSQYRDPEQGPFQVWKSRTKSGNSTIFDIKYN